MIWRKEENSLQKLTNDVLFSAEKDGHLLQAGSHAKLFVMFVLCLQQNLHPKKTIQYFARHQNHHLSRGATAVLAHMPATPPAKRDLAMMEGVNTITTSPPLPDMAGSEMLRLARH